MQGHTFVLLYFLHVLVLTSSQNIINVSPDTTNSNQSLEYYLCTNQLESNTTVLLGPGQYYIGMGNPCVVAGVDNLTIRGNITSDIVELVCTDNYFGRIFAFVNVTNLFFENLLIKNCGDFIPESLASFINETNVVYFGEKQKAVLLLAQVTNAYFNRIIMSRNFGYGIVGVNLQGETILEGVQIVFTSYENHPLCFDFVTDLSCVGSGAFFLYSDPPPNASFSQINSSLTVTNCNFRSNSYIIPTRQYLAVYIIARSPFLTERFTAIGGTGISLYSGQKTYFLDVHVANTTFSKNDGQSSSLLFIPVNNIRETSYLVENCTFQDNLVRFPGRGGGMVFLFLLFVDSLNDFPLYPDNVYTILTIRDTEFSDNMAGIGGAIHLHMSPQNVTDYQVYIHNTSFYRNVAQAGSALSANSIPTLFVSRYSEILLEDVLVMNNTFPSTLATTTSTIDNSAALIFGLINNVTLAGRNSTGGSIFSYNSPGAVLVSGGKLYLRGHLHFSDNLSFRGGAIALYDYTLLYMYEGLRVKFTRNHALTNGGAIYANSIGTGTLDVCVFQILGSKRISDVKDIGFLDLLIQFESNYADVAGNSIYANPLYDCSFSPETSTIVTSFNNVERDIYEAIFSFIETIPNGNEEMSSSPYRLSFCNETTGVNFVGESIMSLTTIPGKSFSVQLIPLDLTGTRVQSEMYAQLSDVDFELGPTQSIQTHNGSNCSTVSFNLYGPMSSTVQLFLYTRLGGIGLTVDVSVEECPPGFELLETNNLLSCVCSRYVQTVIQTGCNSSSYTINRQGSNWIGAVKNNGSILKWVVTCPKGYCNPNIRDIDFERPDEICEPGRTGILCGMCQDGLSIVFGTPACAQCTNYWLFTIAVYAIVGVLLVLALFVLDLTVAKGTINGLIFFVNVVSINGGIFFQSEASFVRVFVSLLNLELGFPICFYDGMTEAAKIGLQFVFPVYLLILCIVIILSSRWSSRIQKLTQANSIAVLATLFYLSYAKLFRTAIDCFSFARVASEQDSKTIWLYDGNLQFFTGLHILLFLAACFVTLFFLLPYTLPLILIKSVDKYTIRLKPLFDAYAGPYKDKYRYWFGLRLVILTAVCITYAVAGADYVSLALTIETFFIVWFTVWQAYAKPYKNRAVGFLDIFFLLNFLTMSVWVLHLIDDVSPPALSKRIGVITFLVALAFIVTLGILLYHILNQIYQKSTKGQNEFDSFWKKATSVDCYQRFKQMKSVMHSRSETFNPTTSVELDSKSTIITHSEVTIDPPRTETFSQLREPVMSFSN